MQDIIHSLNSDQCEAVMHKNGPLLILAGAGSGKTRVLTHRIAHLIVGGVDPKEILAITFTNKAAGEMRERINKLMKNKIHYRDMPWVGTFHSLGASILREEAKRAGLVKNFSILDEEDSLSIIKACQKELDIDPKQFQPTKMRSLISKKKGELTKVEDFIAEARGYFPKTLARIWTLYEQKLKEQKSLDFDDLIVRVVFLFQENPDILKTYQNRWKYVNVDEYQDTDQAQYYLTRLLAGAHNNICVVGDDAQSIYSWRGADFRNILNFETDWPDAKVVMLEQNYRSTKSILDAANNIISKNINQKPKNLFTKKEGGERLQFFAATDEKQEADFVAGQTEKFIEEGFSPSNVAVLYRTNFQSRILEEEFLACQIPYHVVGVKFYNRKEVKDILAYIKATLNSDDILSLRRIINTPVRGIGKVLAAKYFARADLTPADKKKTDILDTLLGDIAQIIEKENVSRALHLIIKKTGYYDFLDDGTDEGQMRLDNLKELVSLAKRYDHLKPIEGINLLLEEAALMSEQDNLKDNFDAVRLMTTHAAKGLEFDIVFVCGLEEGLFPHSGMGGEDEGARLEEERRLFYVALTRAKKRVFLSFASTRMIFGEKQINIPSRFLGEIPEHLIELAGEAELEDVDYES